MKRIGKILLTVAAALAGLYGVLFLLMAAHLRDFKLPLAISDAYVMGATGRLTAEEWDYLTAARKLAFRSPTAEAKRALRRGDNRLIGVAGFGLFFPGTSDSFRNVLTDEKDLASEILGAGDAFSNRTDLLYQEASCRFASLYNETAWPALAQTLPGPALGIAPTRADGEAYYCDGPAHSASAPPAGTKATLLRLSVDRRFDMLEGRIRKMSGNSDVVFERPYARVVGRAERNGHNIVVRYVRELRTASGALVTQREKAVLRNEGGRLLFQDRVLTPCQWLDSAQFYVTFCQFPATE